MYNDPYFKSKRINISVTRVSWEIKLSRILFLRWFYIFERTKLKIQNFPIQLFFVPHLRCWKRSFKAAPLYLQLPWWLTPLCSDDANYSLDHCILYYLKVVISFCKFERSMASKLEWKYYFAKFINKFTFKGFRLLKNTVNLKVAIFLLNSQVEFSLRGSIHH